MQENNHLDPFEEAALERLRNQYREQQRLMREQMEAMQRQFEEQMNALRHQTDAQLASIKEEAEKLQARKAERERLARIEAEKNKPVIVTILGCINWEEVYFSLSDTREDIKEALKDLPLQIHYSKYYVRMKYLQEVLDTLNELPNITISYYEDRIRLRIEEILTKPTWEVHGTHDGKVRAKPRIDVNKSVFNRILTADWNHEDLAWYIPKSEAWRISQLFNEKDFEGAMISEEVSLLIVEQISKRAALDKIALKLESGERAAPEYRINLNGHSLRPFQELSLEFLDATNGRALLAHEMGLGKTWISIAYAVMKEFKQTVIICPASLKPNWRREILKLTGVEPCVLKGKVPTQWDIAYLLEKKPQFIIINYDIVGAKIEIVDKEDAKKKKPAFLWAEVLNMIQPDFIVLDEAHYIKNTSSNRSQACRKLKSPYVLPMTGTPVVNRPGEYWPALYMIDPVLFPYFERFIQNYTLDGKRPANVEQLREMLRPLMLRYTHAQVQKELPPINRMRRFHELSPQAVKDYESVLDGVYRMLEMFDPRGKSEGDKLVMNILAEITRLKQICAADQVEETADLATELYDSADDPSKKVIVFSKFKATAAAIAQRLGEEAVCTVRRTADEFVTVNVDERMKLVDQFQNDPNVHYIVTTIGAAAEGLTMTRGYYVIFNDLDWTPKAHKQAEGRARGRLNDSHNIDSYTMIAQKPEDHPEGPETIMHWLLDLLGFKESVFEETVEGVEQSRSDDESVAMALIKKVKEQMEKRRKVA